MAHSICPQCFQSDGTCYAVCPSQDPWRGDHALEDAQSQPDADPSLESLGGDVGDDWPDESCTDPGGHEWYEGEPDRMDEGPIRCIHCGADGDA